VPVAVPYYVQLWGVKVVGILDPGGSEIKGFSDYK
jgi:hypothetical protein